MNAPSAPIIFTSGDPVPIDRLVEAHRRLVDPSRPSELRQRIARGLLPSTMQDLVPTLAYLCHDPVAGVKSAAIETLAAMDTDELSGIISELADPHVLDTLGRVLSHEQEPALRVVTNRHTTDPTLVYLAGAGTMRICDTIGRNAVRCLAHPPLIEALYFNPKAPQGAVQNLIELAVREKVDLDHMPGFIETRAALMGERGAEDDGVVGLDELEFLSALDQAAFDFDGEGGEDEEARKMSLQGMLLQMSVAQKIRLALVGDANARKLLIRDPKKMVALAVMKSPRLTDGEVKIFAANKALAEEIISFIARRRSWTKDYSIRRALILNPKTPAAIALGFLRTMGKADMKMIAKNRDISPLISRQAARVIDKEQEKRKK